MAKKSDKNLNPLTVGTAVFIRTVAYHYTGRIVEITPTDILISHAAWIADTSRFAAALATGALAEVEPYPDGIVAVGRGAICDVSVWAHELPRAVL